MNWADDVDDDVAQDAPRVEERDEGNGIKVITEYRTNPEGKKVKVCRVKYYPKCPAVLCLILVFPLCHRSHDEFDAHLSPQRLM